MPDRRATELPRDPFRLDRTVIAVPLLETLGSPAARQPLDVIIDVNLMYPGGRERARERARELVGEAAGRSRGRQGLDEAKTAASSQYLFARLTGPAIRRLVRLDREAPGPHAIHRVWPDFRVKALITTSVRTVKADAAARAFSALGHGITWAVIDSGIDASHAHFALHGTLELGGELAHRDFTGGDDADALTDPFGHGTHVAGIIAGELLPARGKPIRAFRRNRDEQGEVGVAEENPEAIAGMAPRCKLLSLRVLDDAGDGLASNLITALEHVQRLNGDGRLLRVQGVNMSVGYEFDPEWFACGQSPLCVQVDQLVRSGVVVVVAAGNTGFGWAQTAMRGTVSAGIDLTINDPGNAERAITVGSTHRDSPHVYGVSYFSSKGPTGDGRLKPDLVAPGEKIMSCAAGTHLADIEGGPSPRDYVEQSGTSMAAPHVSGVIAAFLSVRQEFVGRPERVKDIFTSTATDLRRRETFQGRGLVDLMRAIQSV
jgi:subtilisin family serine protease